MQIGTKARVLIELLSQELHKDMNRGSSRQDSVRVNKTEANVALTSLQKIQNDLRKIYVPLEDLYTHQLRVDDLRGKHG